MLLQDSSFAFMVTKCLVCTNAFEAKLSDFESLCEVSANIKSGADLLSRGNLNDNVNHLNISVRNMSSGASLACPRAVNDIGALLNLPCALSVTLTKPHILD